MAMNKKTIMNLLIIKPPCRILMKDNNIFAAINKELNAYSIDLTKKKQVIAANKTDLIPADTDPDPVQRIRDKYEPLGIRVFAISAATNSGIREMLYYISGELQKMPRGANVFSQEYDPEEAIAKMDDSFTVGYDEEKGEYVVEGARIERMLNNTNLSTEKGFRFFQKFMEDNGIISMLKEEGLKEGDTVRLYGHSFEYYES